MFASEETTGSGAAAVKHVKFNKNTRVLTMTLAMDFQFCDQPLALQVGIKIVIVMHPSKFSIFTSQEA